MKRFGKNKVTILAVEDNVLWAVRVKELNRNGKIVVAAEPDIFVPISAARSKDNLEKIKWAKYDPESKNVIDSEITPAILVNDVICILLDMDYYWPEEIRKRLSKNMIATDRLFKDNCMEIKENAYFITNAKIKFAEDLPKVNLKGMEEYGGKITPITDALWEVFIYGCR